MHSIRIVADGWRSATIERIGEKRWKGYAIASIIGFVLIIWGRHRASGRDAAVVSPVGVRHLTGMLTAIAFVLIAASLRARQPHQTRRPSDGGRRGGVPSRTCSRTARCAVVLFGAFFMGAGRFRRVARA